MKIRHILTALALLAFIICTIQPVMAGTEEIQDNATSYYNLGEISIDRGEYDKAVMYFDLALAENTTLIGKGDALMYLYKDKAAALTDLGRYDLALKTVNTGLIQFRNSSGMWNNKGWVLFKMGRYNEAVDAYSQAVTIDPAYFKGWLNKGNALNAAGRYQEAVEAYTRALELDPGSMDAMQGHAAAQKAAANAQSVTTIILVIIVIVAAGVAVWYVKFRKPAAADKADKKSKKN